VQRKGVSRLEVLLRLCASHALASEGPRLETWEEMRVRPTQSLYSCDPERADESRYADPPVQSVVSSQRFGGLTFIQNKGFSSQSGS